MSNNHYVVKEVRKNKGVLYNGPQEAGQGQNLLPAGYATLSAGSQPVLGQAPAAMPTMYEAQTHAGAFCQNPPIAGPSGLQRPRPHVGNSSSNQAANNVKDPVYSQQVRNKVNEMFTGGPLMEDLDKLFDHYMGKKQ